MDDCLMQTRSTKLISRLIYRESALMKPNTQSLFQHSLYTNIYPNKTSFDTEHQPFFLVRKFSPDGRHLVCFSQNQHALRLYRYCIPFQSVNAGQSTDESDAALPRLGVPELRFSDVFTQVYERVITGGSAMLCKDFCLFTRNKKHMILASATPSNCRLAEAQRFPTSLTCITNQDDVTFWVIDVLTGDICDSKTYRNDYMYLTNHAGVHLFDNLLGITSVQNQCIYILMIKDSGQMVEVNTVGYFSREDDELQIAMQSEAELKFNNDVMEKQLNDAKDAEAVETNDGRLTRASLTPQLVNGVSRELLEIAFLRTTTTISNDVAYALFNRSIDDHHNNHEVPIARGVNSNTANIMNASRRWNPRLQLNQTGMNGFFSSASEIAFGTSIPPQITEELMPMGAIKQRIMAYLYKRALTSSFPGAMNHFHLTFPHFVSMVMWRMQFLDRHRILIKLGSIENITGRAAEPSTGFAAFFAVYCMKTTAVLGVFENNSEELFEMFEKWDMFCEGSVSFDDPVVLPSRPNTSSYARQLVRKQMFAVTKARNGGWAQAIRRVLSSLPVNPQSFSESPYFDHGLFSYDDKTLNSSERIRPFVDAPCKFYCRETGRHKFRLDTTSEQGQRLTSASNHK